MLLGRSWPAPAFRSGVPLVSVRLIPWGVIVAQPERDASKPLQGSGKTKQAPAQPEEVARVERHDRVARNVANPGKSRHKYVRRAKRFHRCLALRRQTRHGPHIRRADGGGGVSRERIALL
jgi:hypothetical protein